MTLTSLQPSVIRALMVHQLTTAAPPAWIEAISGPVLPSGADSETHATTGTATPLNVWPGGTRPVRNLITQQITVVNEVFESQLYVTGKDYRASISGANVGAVLGSVQKSINQLTARYQQHWTKLVSGLITANPLCYDGQNWFDTDHVDPGASYSTAQSNAIQVAAASGTTPTVAEMEDAIGQACTKLLGFLDDNGEPMNDGASQFMVMAPVALYRTASAAVGSTVIAEAGIGARSSTLATLPNMTFSVVPNPRLAAPYIWVWIPDGQAVIRQERLGLQVDVSTTGSTYTAQNDKHLYGVMTERGTKPADWRKVCRVEFT